MGKIGGLGFGEMHGGHPTRRAQRERIEEEATEPVEGPFVGQPRERHGVRRSGSAILRGMAGHAAHAMIQALAPGHGRFVRRHAFESRLPLGDEKMGQRLGLRGIAMQHVGHGGSRRGRVRREKELPQPRGVRACAEFVQARRGLGRQPGGLLR